MTFLACMFCFPNTGRVIINTLENCFFQISSYSHAYLCCIIYENTNGQVLLQPLLGEQTIPAKEVSLLLVPAGLY